MNIPYFLIMLAAIITTSNSIEQEEQNNRWIKPAQATQYIITMQNNDTNESLHDRSERLYAAYSGKQYVAKINTHKADSVQDNKLTNH